MKVRIRSLIGVILTVTAISRVETTGAAESSTGLVSSAKWEILSKNVEFATIDIRVPFPPSQVRFIGSTIYNATLCGRAPQKHIVIVIDCRNLVKTDSILEVANLSVDGYSGKWRLLGFSTIEPERFKRDAVPIVSMNKGQSIYGLEQEKDTAWKVVLLCEVPESECTKGVNNDVTVTVRGFYDVQPFVVGLVAETLQTSK